MVFMVQFYTEEGFLGLYMSYYIRTVYSYNIFGEKKKNPVTSIYNALTYTE